MQYKALYRKYRPMDLEDLIGQDAIVRTLLNSLKESKIGHAYLFTGTRGTGKTSVAKIFAKLINCEDLKDGRPCGKCKICNITKTDENPDIIEMDAASNNGVDEIREIINKALLLPIISKYKVYIIDEVHMLTTQSFNALLKTLEEPPSHTIFILATTEPQKVPITIISRCQRFDFKKISVLDIKNRLLLVAKKENIKIEDECLNEIAIISDGSMRDAIGLLDQSNSISDEKITSDKLYELTGNLEKSKLFVLVEYIFVNDVNSLIEMFDDLYQKGKNFERISESLLDIFMNIMLYKNAKKYFDKKNLYYKEDIIRLEKLVNRERLHKLVQEANLVVQELKNSSNQSLLFELFLLRIVDIDIKNEEKQCILVENNEKDLSKNEKKIISGKTEKPLMCSYTFKEALINNTIALASREYKNEVKKAFLELDKTLVNSKNKSIIMLLKDSTINAASENRLLLTYKYDNLVFEHDENNNKIEKLVSELLSRKYKVVAITEDKWDELRPKFLELKNINKKIDLMDEITEESIPCKIESDTKTEDTLEEFGFEVIEMEE